MFALKMLNFSSTFQVFFDTSLMLRRFKELSVKKVKNDDDDDDDEI